MDLETVRQNTTATILRFSVPAIVAMLLTSLITVADGFFVGNYVGAEGIAAVNLGLPIIYLFLSIGLMVSVGGAALAQIAFGAGDRSACCQVFRQTVATTVVFAVLTGAAVALFFEPMLDILGAQGQVREYFKSYYVILLPELILMVVNSCLGMFIRGEGNPQFFMKVLDECIPAKDMKSIGMYCALTFAIALYSAFGLRYKVRVTNDIGQNIIHKLRSDIFEHLQELPFSYYDDRPHGKIQVRVVNYVNSLSDLLSNGIINTITDLCNLIFILVFMLLINVRLTSGTRCRCGAD